MSTHKSLRPGRKIFIKTHPGQQRASSNKIARKIAKLESLQKEAIKKGIPFYQLKWEKFQETQKIIEDQQRRLQYEIKLCEESRVRRPSYYW